MRQHHGLQQSTPVWREAGLRGNYEHAQRLPIQPLRNSHLEDFGILGYSRSYRDSGSILGGCPLLVLLPDLGPQFLKDCARVRAKISPQSTECKKKSVRTLE